ncbi:MAG TPA: spermidine synthase [Nitrospiria bacterium]|nr:spermidine synthase [Nitrospiria bacterium]
MTALLCTIFFISGASALIFEMLWFHQAGLAFGNSVWASSLVLSGFMGGLALGNAMAARYGAGFRSPIRIYAFAEAAVALTGLGLVYQFPFIGAFLAPWLHPLLENPWLLNPIRLLVAFCLLLIPSTAMGVTLPLLTKALMAYDTNFGSVLGRLYGWNTMGAVIAVVLGEIYLIGALGIHGTAILASGSNLTAAVAAAGLSLKTPRLSLSSVNAGRRATALTGKHWLAAACLSGLCLLALEVVWFRFLLLFVLGHSVAFALMLGLVLLGIGLGGLAASQWLRLSLDAYRFTASIAFLAGFLCVISYAVFPWVLRPFADSSYVISKTVDILAVGAPLMFPVSFLSGVFFTLVGAALRNDLASETETTGTLTFVNTVGAALGSLVGGFVLLPVLGMEKSFFLIALLYGAIGALLLAKTSFPRRITYATAALFLLSALLFPFGSMEKHHLRFSENRYLKREAAWNRYLKIDQEASSRVAATRESLTETISFLETRLLGRPMSYTLLTNSSAMSGTESQSRRYMKLYVYWPMAVHPNLKRALLICYGVGNTAKAMTDSKSLETIDVVDISRAVLEMSDVVYPNNADNPLHDPRVRVHIEDGRYFLQTTDQHFDLITAEPPPPENAGVVNLYTREYFQLIHDRLAEGGIVTYWLPLKSLTEVSAKAVLRAFCDAFEDCSLWNGIGGDMMMVGTRKARGPVSEEQFARQWSDPVAAPEMSALGFERPEQLGALFIGDEEYLKSIIGDSPPLVDDDPKRIVAPSVSPKESARMMQSFTDASGARTRFRQSPLIKRLWPERQMTASLPYFDIQAMINARWFGPLSKQDLNGTIGAVHRLLTGSDLKTPVLWLLGSDSDVQRIVARAGPEEVLPPALEFHIGIRLISERQYAAAVEALGRTEQVPEFQELAFRLRIYALCMSGRTRQAQQLAEEHLVKIFTANGMDRKSMDKVRLEPFWSWMKQAFGIDPLKSV